MRRLFITFVLAYLRFWARLALALNKPTVIGLTGSVGKSSERNALHALLKDYFPTKVIEKGNSETGIPLGILGLSVKDYSPVDWVRLLLTAPLSLGYLKNTKYLIIEMGVDEPYPPKNMGYLLTIVKPQISLFLNVYPAHTLQFEQALTAEEKDRTAKDPKKRLDYIQKIIAFEKGKIITDSQCSLGIYNKDNRYVNAIVKNFEFPTPSAQHNASHFQNFHGKTKLLSFGKEETNDIYFGHYEVSLEGTMFTFYLNTNDQKESILLKLRGYALPKEYQEIFAAAILVGKYLGLSNYQITQSLQKNYMLPKSRASLLAGIRHSVILDSSYNASRAAVVAFLDMAYELKRQTKSPLVFLFGDMRELGEEAEAEHAAVVEKIKEGVDYLYCVGSLTKKYVLPEFQNKKSTLKDLQWFANSVEAGQYLKQHQPEAAIVLVKGSQNTIFLEEAVKEILLDKADIKKLCRQEDFWIKKKDVR